MKNAAQAAISLVLIALLATGATISACSSADAQGGNSGARLNAALDEAGVESITGQIKVVHVKLGELTVPLTQTITITKAPEYRQLPQVSFDVDPTFSGTPVIAAIEAIRNSGGHIVNREVQSRGFMLRPDGNRLPLTYTDDYNSVAVSFTYESLQRNSATPMLVKEEVKKSVKSSGMRITEEQINLLDDLECTDFDSDSGDCAIWTAPASNLDGEYYITLTYAL